MSGIPKLLIIYAIAIPLAIVLGFLISSPDMKSVVIIGMILFLFTLPFLLKHHHFLLIIFWNSAFNVFFLPAQPHFWLLLAGLSFGISWLNNIMGRKNFIKVPEIARPLIFFGIIVVATALARGGFGIRALGGSSYGGKGYIYIVGAILGYFALTAERVPAAKAKRWTGLFFLSGTSYAFSNLIYILGSSFYILYLLVPSEYALAEAAADTSGSELNRIAGLTPMCAAIVYFLMARYGIKGILNWRNPWRLLALCATLALCAFGGYRSIYLLIGIICVIQFFLEGLHKTVFLPISLGVAIVMLVPVMTFSDRLPLSVQRAISFLPVKVDSGVETDAKFSMDWRMDMWKTLLPDIPKYFFLGKGYRIDPEDLALASMASQMGLTDMFEVSIVAGDYHSGPLSLLISFGAMGFVAFIWLIYAGTKVLYRNYRYGLPGLRGINTFLLAFFSGHAVHFFGFYGDVRTDLFLFTGVLGLSVSLNGGVIKKPVRKSNVAMAVELTPQLA